MITIDSDPKANPIFLGGVILRFFQDSGESQKDITSLYNYVNGNVQLSFELFLYSLDWLYIIGAIDLDENGDIVYAAE
ncbi:ABC-three component system middle component 6 [Serratia proteamaculans]|uniref:Uncharacterized protein n=1 Tax=Serratia proteamaculans TaxID=28151 RepID=A0ABS0TX46_SERPR|nr:ABC-three component system middle component 6 [Serratia proteamaculans]MBI6181835.1 hypothetical protein [Serratia proteamaculans]WEO88495.1 hypothetical protein JET59_020395 [Serratia proteamaculans]